MHHGNGPSNTPRQLQRSRSFTGNEAEETSIQTNLPQSPAPAPSFAPAVSSPGPQSPSYQIQQLIMSRNPVAGQNVNITLQNVGQVVAGNQQITLTPLPIPNPASPGFQFSSQTRRFEHGSPSYIQVTSPMSQQVQTQSPTQPSAVPIQALQGVRAATAGASLGMCSQSPTRGFVDASVLVRQISLSPSNGGHFVFQEGSGLAQIAQGATAQVQLPSGAAQATIRERRLSQPHSQTGGTIHHLGPQSPVASGANLQTLTTPSHITTTNLPPQISSIIQGQLIQQQQVLHGQQLGRTISFDRTSGGMIAGVAAASSFGITSSPTPTSPSRITGSQALCSLSLTPTVSTIKKQSKKLEEIPPATAEDAQMRKQCLEHHNKYMKSLKEHFKDYLIELFFLQHFQGNMMDFLAFKKKPSLGLQGYLRQNDLDLEEEEEEEQSEVINDEVKIVTGKDGQTGTPVAIATQLPPNVSAAFSSQQQPFQQSLTGSGAVGAANAIDIEAFKRQQALTQADPSKRPRLDMPRHGMVFQHPGVASGVPLQQLMPTAQGGMPPTPQTVQLTGQKQSQQQYDPSKGPPVQNAASLHTPPPQLTGRVQASNIPISSLPTALHLAQQQQQLTEGQIQPQIQVQVKAQAAGVPIQSSPQNQLPAQISQTLQTTFHAQMPIMATTQPQGTAQQQTVTLMRPTTESPQQKLTSSSQPSSFVAPAAISNSSPVASFSLPTNRTNQTANKAVSSTSPKASGSALAATVKVQTSSQSITGVSPEIQDKSLEQENHVHQRVADLRKEGLWSLRRLPKLQEPSRPKSHWDYLLEEMQWMAADYAQERRWKMACAKKLVRTAARYHEEKIMNIERAKTEEENKLKRIAASIAREIEYFWSNIEQVVEIKLQMEFQEKRRKAHNLNMDSMKGPLKAIEEACVKHKHGDIKASPSWRKRKASSSWSDGEGDDEEETIAEQETKESSVDHQAELTELIREADLPLDDLVKEYEGAYDENFHWPHVFNQNEEGRKSSQDIREHPGEADMPQKHCTTVLIDSLLGTDQYRSVDRSNTALLSSRKHTRDVEDVARAAELLFPSGSSRVTCAVKPRPSPLLHGTLREYQLVGLDWLEKQYKKNLNGILADESGLGKNIQVIALMAHLASNEGNWGPHLIVVRSCKLLKWELEFKRWCPGLKMLLYFGKQRDLRKKRQRWGEPNNFHVCITSYKQLFKGIQAFMKMRWRYLVLDEVHQIRNMNEKHWDAIFNLPSQNRLLLRDTPLQNTWKDHWTMMHFLIPGISKPYLDFPLKTNGEENQENCHKLFIMLHRTVRPFVLRRSKKDVEKQLPKKYEHVLKCRLSNRQRALYEDVILQPGTQDSLKGGHFVSVLHVLMQLQRICNHPDLVDPRPGHSSYACEALQYKTASLVLQALDYDPWKGPDLSLFNLIGLENKMTRYEAQVLPVQKVTQRLMEEIYSNPDTTARPNPVKIKPSRLFQPVPYGQKPDGRTVTFSNTPASRLVTATTTTVTQQGQARGRSPVTMASANQGGDVVKIAQLAASGAAQGKIAQPKTPVTLQFQGNTFTLSQSQLRQLTAGQPLQLQGSVLQIVSAPGQQYIRPPGPVVMQTVAHGNSIQNAMNALGNQHPSNITNPTVNPHSGIQGRTIMPYPTSGDMSSSLKAPQISVTPAQDLVEEKQRVRERLESLFSCNERRCGQAPVYGADLLRLCSVRSSDVQTSMDKKKWAWVGSVNCLNSSCRDFNDPLRHLILSPKQQKEMLEPTARSTLCVVPAAVAPPPELVTYLPPLYSHSINILRHCLRKQTAPYIQDLWERTSPHCMQSPDLRLIQCDSGKLEALSILLRKLRFEGHRVLIFSQMLLMLDILEIFMDFHYFTFIRIDECASYEQCRDLMRSFNQDSRIFCILMSTQSRTLGVPFVEADIAIFYDSDLNPVMDSRAQAWCDRISRDRDIHIYRLVSGNSVEEKLLKNGTKDLIREVAAQGTDFSMAFLTQQTIHELFELYSPLEDSGFGVKAEEFVMLSQDPPPAETIATKFAKPFIEALKSIELGGELDMEISELETKGDNMVTSSDGCRKGETSELTELAAVVEQLTPIEKYALNYLEEFYTSGAAENPENTEEQKITKKKWEALHLKENKEWEERMAWEEAEEQLLTYTREDAYNKEFICDGPDGQTEVMPIWTPPTPPQDENDIYIDSVMCLMYDSNSIPESKLPPVYVRKEHKRHKADPAAAGRKKKQRHGESVVPPRSLFDRATPGMLKVKREGKEQKKNILLKQQAQFAKPLPTLVKPANESGPDNPEWLISEDWALLQAVKHLLELPLNLTVVSPAHTPNWDLVSDVVNSCSRIYRSSKQCRSRYENVIIPREEGKIMFEANPKKKTKSIYKTKNSRPLRTSQIYAQDEGVTHTQLYTSRFELMKMTAGKRSPPIKPLLGMNPFQKNPKHASVLTESGISYDKPLPPIQVASLRAERIAKEKKALVEQHHRAQQQAGPQAPQQPLQNGQQPSAPAIQPAQAQPQQQVVQTQVVQQPQAVVASPVGTSVPTTAVLAGTIKTAVTGASIQAAAVSGNVIVNTVAGVPSATFQPINKRLGSPVIPGTLAASGGSPQVVHTQQRAVATSATAAEMVTIATNQGVRAVTPVTGGTVVCSSITPVQTQARSVVTQVTTATTAGVQLASKAIASAQFQLIRQQQAAQVQVPQIQAQAQSPGQIKAVGKLSQEQLLKLQKQKMQIPQQTSQTASQQQQQQPQQPQQGGPQAAPVQGQQQAQPQQQAQQLAAVNAPRGGAVLTGATVANLQVARLLQAQGPIQAQPGQTAQVALAKPPVVSAVVSSTGVTTLPVTVAGISVAIGQPQKAAGGQTVVAQPLNVQQLLKLKQQQQQQKALQSGAAPAQAAVQQQKQITAQQVTVQAQQQQQQQATQQQKLTYTTQPAIKTQFLTTPITQSQKSPGAQQVQAQIQVQVAKLPQVVQQQAAVANIPQMVPASQQVQPQSVTLTQATAAGQQQVQVLPAGSAAAQVVQQKLLQQQQVVTAAAASPQLQAQSNQSPVSTGTAEGQNQQAKLQVRASTVRIKAPTKPS
ncbi:E1A-binding protein p400-like isoform X1 [Rana temporaria]|uniref:E1A-binding protein p400-like isoform X1 n=1 Tax=Rana temporaria TaxID=8407 RepID=UPI001AAD15BB|nr:E1A-binding protein p400-like isoform X1 [Rana temporaria]